MKKARQCRKKRFATELDARIALSTVFANSAWMRHHTEVRRAESRVYRCPRCHGWHMTSEPQRT